MTNKKVFVSDLDGTLFNSNHDVSQTNIAAIKKVLDNGDIFLIATGRIIFEIGYVFSRLGLVVPAITSNGGYVSDQNQNIIYKKTLPIEIARDLYKMRDEHDPDLPFHLYAGEGWYVESIDPLAVEYQEHSNFRPTIYNDINQFEEVNKIFYLDLGQSHDLAGLSKKIAEKYGDQVYMTFSTPSCLEVMHKDVNKATGINILLKTLGTSLDQAIVFGDGMNDLEMLQQAKQGYLMSNADQRLVAKLKGAKNITQLELSNNQSGVGETILNFYQ